MKKQKGQRKLAFFGLFWYNRGAMLVLSVFEKDISSGQIVSPIDNLSNNLLKTNENKGSSQGGSTTGKNGKIWTG
jgi:hypothetical protein